MEKSSAAVVAALAITVAVPAMAQTPQGRTGSMMTVDRTLALSNTPARGSIVTALQPAAGPVAASGSDSNGKALDSAGGTVSGIPAYQFNWMAGGGG